MFGLPAEDDGTRTDPLLGQNIVTCTHYEPDFDALRAASTRIVLAAGVESDGEMAHRGAEAVAERLGTDAGDLPERPRRASSVASTASPATRTASPRSCARSSTGPEHQRPVTSNSRGAASPEVAPHPFLRRLT